MMIYVDLRQQFDEYNHKLLVGADTRRMQLRGFQEQESKGKDALQTTIAQFYSQIQKSLTQLQIINDYQLLTTQIEPSHAPLSKLVITWEHSELSSQIWWEYDYDPNVKTLTLLAYLTKNCNLTNVTGQFDITLLMGLFESYSKQLQANKQNFQYNFNPLSGCVRIVSKLLISPEQLISQMHSILYLMQVMKKMKTMVTMCGDLMEIDKYVTGRSKQCPIPQFMRDSKILENQIAPQMFLDCVNMSLNLVDANGEENLEDFGSLSNIINQVISLEVDFPQEIKNIINIIQGDKNHKNFVNMPSILSKIYEKSSTSDNGNQIQNLAMKIDILTPPQQIQWKPFAQGGFGLVQKAYVQYELFQYGNPVSFINQGYIVRKSDLKTTKIPHEHRIFQLLKNQYHPNIMPHYIPKKKIYQKYIFSKFQPNLSLDKYLKVNKKSISLVTIIRLMQHCVKGLMFLKQKNIVHLDIKPNNIIITKDLKAKISDFGQAYFQQDDILDHNHGFTVPYIPVEAFFPQPYFNSKVDVYAIGVTIFKVLFNNHIFGEILDCDKFLQQMQLKEPTIIMVPQKLFKQGGLQIICSLANLCLKCVNRQQNNRPSLFYVSVILKFCQFYLHSLTNHKLQFF